MMAARRTDGQREVLLATKEGMVIRFAEDEVRPVGRVAAGVRGIDLEDGDQVIAAEVAQEGVSILTITARGLRQAYAARGVPAHRARRARASSTSRPAAGTARWSACCWSATTDDVLVVTTKGKIIRVHADEVTSQGRNTMGVRIIDLDPDDQVGSIARVEAEQTTGTESSA